MNTASTSPDQIFGYQVVDSTGNKLGAVDSVWVDDASGELEFIAVKTGFLFGKNHVMPATNANIDAGNNTIQVPYAQEQVKDAPSFGGDSELSPEDENTIYSYYGLDRSTGTSPTGLATGDSSAEYPATDYETSGAGAGNSGYADTMVAQDSVNVPLAEEELQVGKREVQSGQVRLRKVVRTEEVSQPVELRHEEVQIERVTADDQSVPDNAFQEGTVEIPVMREEAVVGKEARVTGQVNLQKNATTETETISDTVRREDVEVDDSGVATGSTSGGIRGAVDSARDRFRGDGTTYGTDTSNRYEENAGTGMDTTPESR